MSVATQPRTRRTHKPAPERRAEILSAASLVFAASGYRAADVQEIADRAGVGKGTVYRHFPTKEALFLAALEESMRQLSERMRAAKARHADPVEQLRAAVHTYLAFFDRHPETVELFIHERAEFRDRAKPLYFAYSEAHCGEWVEVFRSMVDDGHLPADRIQPAMQALSDLMYGAVLSNRVSGRDRPLLERLDAILDLYLYGIFLRPEHPC